MNDDMPERIWAWHRKDPSLNAKMWEAMSDAPCFVPGAEYVRADLAFTAQAVEIERLQNKSTLDFVNCCFDLRGADYDCVLRTENEEIGVYADGERVLINQDGSGFFQVDFHELNILSHAALEKQKDEAVSAAIQDAFTAADLHRAWEMGRDQAYVEALVNGAECSPLDAIEALTPPTDLAEKVKNHE